LLTCDNDENKISIKLIHRSFSSLVLGLTTLDYDFNHSYNSIGTKNSWGVDVVNRKFLCDNEWILCDDIRADNGDTVGLKYNSKKGEIEFFINNQTKGIIFKGLNITQCYRFAIELHDVEQTVQIID